MNILFLSACVPDPNGGGASRRAALHLQALRGLGRVTMVLPPDDTQWAVTDGLNVLVRGPTLADQRLARKQAARSRLARAWHGWRMLNMIDARASGGDAARFARELEGPFDLVFAGRLRCAVWWESLTGRRRRPGETRIADFDDIESRMLSNWLATISLSPFWTWKLRRQVDWLRRLECRIATTWDAVLLCSKVDATRLHQATGKEAVIVPNGYPLQPARPERDGPACNLLFVGSLDYFPNSQGVEWFVAAIWAQVKDALGDGVRLDLVGLNAPPGIVALGEREGIAVTSSAPSVDRFYDAANIVIAPLRAGSGTRIKLIEAAAMGRAIVTTTLGCEGLGFVDGVHAEIADDPADFAARIVALARDPARRTALAQAARAHAEREFSADTIVADLRSTIGLAVGRLRCAEVSSRPVRFDPPLTRPGPVEGRVRPA